MIGSSYLKNNMFLDFIKKDDKYKNIQLLKSLINTFIDMINTIINAYYENKDIKNIKNNYIFELIVRQFLDKLNKMYRDKNFTEIIFNKMNKNIRKKNNSIIFVKRKDKKIVINENNTELNYLYNKNELCINTIQSINTNNMITETYYNNKMLCNDGKIHNWITTDKIICSKCNINFKDVIDKKNNNNNIINNYKLLYLKKLTKTYCIDGKIHNIKNNICSLCKKNPSTYNYNNNELYSLENSLNNSIISNVKEMKQKQENIIKQRNKFNNYVNNVMDNFNKKFDKDINNNFNNYIYTFFTDMKKINNNSDMFKIKNKKYYLTEDKITINNNFKGKKLNEPLIIYHNINNKKFNIGINIHYHKEMKRNVYVYFNRKNKYYLFYDCYTNLYLGFSSNIDSINIVNSFISIDIEYSIKNKLLNLGYSSIFMNLNMLQVTEVNKNNIHNIILV
jgi:hypothetical protein